MSSESLVADVTFMRPLAGVRQLVSAEIATVGESHLAEVALVWLHAGVREQVPVQAAALRELLPTQLAREPLLAGVRDHVLVEVAEPHEPHAAHGAHMRLVVGVQPDVPHQVARVEERLQADVALVRPRAGVHALVFPQGLLVGESFLAHVARVRPLTVAAVRRYVSHEVARFNKRFCADITHVRPIGNTHPPMSSHSSLVTARLVAYTTIVWLQPRINTLMISRETGRIELRTRTTRSGFVSSVICGLSGNAALLVARIWHFSIVCLLHTRNSSICISEHPTRADIIHIRTDVILVS